MRTAFRIDKIEKFLLCENHLRNENEHLNRVFILHTRKPTMLIQVHWMDDLRESLDLTSADICNISTNISFEDGDTELILRTIFLYEEAEKPVLEKVVKAATDWYLQHVQNFGR